MLTEKLTVKKPSFPRGWDLVSAFVFTVLMLLSTDSLRGQTAQSDTLRFPLSDRRGDPIQFPSRNPFDLQRPSAIRDSIVYDPATRQYLIYEKIGTTWFRKPSYLRFEEMDEIMGKQMETDYFRRRLNTALNLNRKIDDPKLQIRESYFDRIFSNTGIPQIDIRPQGDVTITAGYLGQNIKNPTLTERARRNGGFDFDMQANFGINASIGDKLRFPVNYNTLANFEFENQLKLDYSGNTDEIFKRIEAGNINFPARGTLMPGAQSLFGLKTELQFGKLYITALVANQRASRQQMQLQGGTGVQQFEIKADEYEENRHFLLAQYFRNNFNRNMRNVPAVTTPVQILRLEVWVTNRTGSTTENRNVVGLMDLGERDPFNTNVISLGGSEFPNNNSNDLYQRLINDPSFRDASLVTNRLQSIGLVAVQDFERTFARKLRPEEYYFNPQIGFISLQQPLQPDEVLGVAFQYTVNGRVFQLGEFSIDVTPDTAANNSGTQKVLFLKMLKATSQRPLLPIWDLMMKNVYSVGFGQLERKDFKMNLLYQEPGGGEKRYLPEGEEKGKPILELVNLDRLNNQNDPQPDGVFDYVEGFTVLTQYSRIIFPLLEPFGRDLEFAFRGADSIELRKKYLFYPLYDSIRWVAQQSPQLNRFVFRGTSRNAGGGSEIYLGAFNVPPGSVTVMAGGQMLRENVDYTVDYNLGSVKILNQAIINSNMPVNVQFENNATFGMQQRNFMALRLDYRAIERATRQLNLGAAVMRLGERPFFTKMNWGDDPIRNTMVGGDISYRSDWKRLTKWLDALPFYTTRQNSSINVYGEAAQIIPGHPKQIRPESGRDAGLIYIDDFEGTRNGIDLRFPFISWALASTPYKATGAAGNELFPEAGLINNLDYGKNRAKLAWYNIEPVLQERRSPNNPLGNNLAELSDPRVRLVNRVELFPQATPDLGQNQLITFDMAYYPTERGPYNYDASSGSIDPVTGRLAQPRKRWGGIMRAIDQIDFETNNIEFIEFWVQDPYILRPNSSGGQLYFNLGNISEDIMKDGRRFYENGLSTSQTPAREDTSAWGRVPRNPIQIAQAFSNIVEERVQQDVGFDGYNDADERISRADFLSDFRNNFGTGTAFQRLFNDPSSDNYLHFRDDAYNAAGAGILARYKNFNGPQGNSPVASPDQSYTPASTLFPDNEDLNRDNTLNEVEEYFQYKVDLFPRSNPQMQPGVNYIADRREVEVSLADGSKRLETWYLFRIPIREYGARVGNIPDFKSIRFMRMFLTGFEDSVVVRFGKLELVRNMWRSFQFDLDTAGQYRPVQNTGNTSFNVTAVNVEENDKRFPIPYRIPPGIERVQQLSNNGINILQNEQALSMQVCNLQDGDSRAVFKSMNHDLRQYNRIRMFMHAESGGKVDILRNGEVWAVVRFGTDFINNYYEVKMPLNVTRWGTLQTDSIWPAVNQLDIDLDELVRFKLRRAGSVLQRYTETKMGGISWTVMGNPNLGEVRGFLVGVENPKNDNNASVCTEVWINELRLSGLDEKGGFAATGRMDINLADLGTVSVSAGTRTAGFGTIEQRVNERSREYFSQVDIATSLQLGKLLPKNLGLDIPFYASYSQITMTPEYDPYDQDVNFRDKVKTLPAEAKDSVKSFAQDYTAITTVNVTNMRMNKTNGSKPKIYDVSNFDISYSYTKTEKRNPLIENDVMERHYGGVGYNFAPQSKYWEPFKKVIKTKTKWLDLIRDFNFNYRPSLLSFRADVNRQFGAARAREVQIPGVPPSPFLIPETYDKFFTFDRVYNMRWDITRALNVDFSATNNARIDEPDGRIDTKEKRDSVRNNFLKGGRNTIYRQSANLSYTLPVSKFPLLDWTEFRFNYNSTYQWIGASRLAINLGNIVENTQQRVLNGQLDFMRLYNKSKWLRNLEMQLMNYQRSNAVQGMRQKEDTVSKRKVRATRDEGAMPEIGTTGRVLGKLLTSVKRINLNYSENFNTRLPGFTESPLAIGQNWQSSAPGLDFVFGRQPDTSWLNQSARRNWMTRDSNFNFLFTQSYKQELRLEAAAEPLRDLTVDISLTRSFSKNYSELFKDTIGNGDFAHLSPYAGGGFDISFISFKTMFRKYSPTQPGESFLNFESYRSVISQRLGNASPYSGAQQPDGYFKGYGRYAQDVLIPAFIAAYTNEDPWTVGLLKQENRRINDNPFRLYIPKPNWRITYNGLSRIPGLEKIFTNFTMSHAYNSNLSMNSFTSALLFADRLGLGFPSFVDTVSNNFVPYFLVPNVTISERFSPLLGMDVQFTNQLNLKLDYGRSRTISLSLIDYQVSEVRSVEVTVGAGWRKRGLKLPFKIPFSKSDSKVLENDINFRFDLTYRDNAIANNILDQRNTIPTGGQKVLTLLPSIDYVLNNRLRMRLFFEQNRVVGYIATPPPVVNTRAGLQINISLAQ